MDTGTQLARSQEISKKVALLLQKRVSAGAGALQGARAEGVERRRHQLLQAAPADAVGRDDELVRLRGGLRAALGPVLGHAAPARQQLRRARKRRACRRCCTSTTRWSSTAARSSGRSTTRWCASCRREGVTVDPKRRPVRHHRSARRPRPRHRRLQGRLAGRRRAARRPSGLLRHLLPRPRAGADAARRVRRGAAVRAQGARAASGQRRSRRSSATARAAGRR